MRTKSRKPDSEKPMAGLELSGKGIVLRTTLISDGAGLYRHVRDKEIQDNTFMPSPYGRADMTSFLKWAQAETDKGRHFLFTIRRYDNDEPMGLIALHAHFPQPYRAELGYWLGRKFWGQGIMTQAVKLILAFAFDTLKLHRVDVSHFEPNDASRRVIEKCWFRREGVAREAVFKKRRWLDLVSYGLLKQDYDQITRKAKPVGSS